MTDSGFRAASRPPDFDAQIAEAFAIINQGRAAIGKPAFAWSDAHAASAQELTDWQWNAYLTGSDDVDTAPHFDYVGRLERHGLVVQGMWGRGVSEYDYGGSSDGTGDDGKEYPPTPTGWRHPFRTAANHAIHMVDVVATGTFAKRNPGEGHVADFRGDWTHIGVGWAGGFFVVDYGYLPLPQPVDVR